MVGRTRSRDVNTRTNDPRSSPISRAKVEDYDPLFDTNRRTVRPMERKPLSPIEHLHADRRIRSAPRMSIVAPIRQGLEFGSRPSRWEGRSTVTDDTRGKWPVSTPLFCGRSSKQPNANSSIVFRETRRSAISWRVRTMTHHHRYETRPTTAMSIRVENARRH